MNSIKFSKYLLDVQVHLKNFLNIMVKVFIFCNFIQKSLLSYILD